MNILAIIPARNGSVRLKNKNIRDFHGKPLIAWAIEAANNSDLVTKTIVSTNSEKIAEIARSYGANVPFLRPDNLAGDTIGIEPVLVHAIEELQKKGESFDAIVLLMPTSPLRTAEHIDEAITLYKHSKSSSVVAVHKVAGNKNPHWILKEKEGDICLFNGLSLKEIVTRSQDLPVCYSRNDIVYVINSGNLYQEPSNLYGDDVKLFEMDEFYDADVNNEEDWWIAHAKFQRKYLT